MQVESVIKKTGVGLIMCLALLSVTVSAKTQRTPADFQPPQVISTVEPSYPASTVTGGTVVLEATVASSGKVKNVEVLRGASGFTLRALETAVKWKFAPATLDGESVIASLPVAFSFSQPIVWWNRTRK